MTLATPGRAPSRSFDCKIEFRRLLDRNVGRPRLTNAETKGAAISRDAAARKPMVGIFVDCCARAFRGSATAIPSPAMTSRVSSAFLSIPQADLISDNPRNPQALSRYGNFA
jgi:hypothetical protein